MKEIALYRRTKLFYSLFLIWNAAISESPNLKNEQDLRVCAVDGNKDAIVNAFVDGRQVMDIEKYRITTSLFNVTYSDDPVIPTNSNVSQAVSDGWIIFLEPLKPGQHEVKFTASQLAQQNTAEPSTYGCNLKINRWLIMGCKRYVSFYRECHRRL